MIAKAAPITFSMKLVAIKGHAHVQGASTYVRLLPGSPLLADCLPPSSDQATLDPGGPAMTRTILECTGAAGLAVAAIPVFILLCFFLPFAVIYWLLTDKDE